MKTALLKTFGILGLTTLATSSYAQESVHMNHTASYIEMTASAGQEEDFAQFLSGAAPLVKETEPGTALWFALQGSENPVSYTHLTLPTILLV